MAGKQSAFVTGANARLKLGDITLAYATDVSYSVTVQTIPIETLGTYEVRDNTPVAYNIDGSFSIIRYTKAAAAIDASGGNERAISGAAISGNQPNRIPIAEGSLGDHLNPNRILQSGTFDLIITEQVPNDDGSGSVNSSVYKIENCRLTRRGMSLNKRGVYVDQYAFVAILGGDFEDSDFGAALTGIGTDLE